MLYVTVIRKKQKKLFLPNSVPGELEAGRTQSLTGMAIKAACKKLLRNLLQSNGHTELNLATVVSSCPASVFQQGLNFRLSSCWPL